MMNLTQPVILASKSQRRQELLRAIGIEFIVSTKDTDESFPDTLPLKDVALFIAKKKAEAFRHEITEQILITADTVVIKNDRILGKPATENEARTMLKSLSNGPHHVTTGVCIMFNDQIILFDDTTEVHFNKLSREEIDFYIKNYAPFDKAGAYGIQEWVGMIAIEKIIGSYFTVVGLPVHKVYAKLKEISASH